MATAELLISSDSHAALTHEQIKRHLASKFHAGYDDAVVRYNDQMSRGAGKVNQSWQTERATQEAANAFRMRNYGRPGHSDGAARLVEMDQDGVHGEVIYSEVSLFRYVHTIAEGSHEATVAFNDAMHEYGSADPGRLIVSHQIPIFDIEFAVSEVQHVARTRRPVAAATCVPDRAWYGGLFP